MYFKENISIEDNAKIVAWASIAGLIMTFIGWVMIILSENGETPLIPTTFIVISLSILLTNDQYDEFQRSIAHSGAIGGMLAVTFWTALVPIISDHLSLEEFAFWKATSDPRFTFYIAASGFFIGFFWKRRRGV